MSSRFNFLKDECIDEDTNDKSNKKDNGVAKNKTNKKKNKKKPQVISNGDTPNMDEWKQIDAEVCDVEYQKDMEEAIIQSKLEMEMQKVKIEEMGEQPVEDLSKAARSKTKNKNRIRDGPCKTISLNEFHQMAEPTVKNPEPKSSKPDPVDTLFEDAHVAAKRLLGREKDREEYDRRFKVETVIKSYYTQQLDEKDKTIEAKQTEIDHLRENLVELKARLEEKEKSEKRLEKIVNHGKMSEVKNLVQQVDDLSTIRDELTSQLTEVTAELEKERSKNHQLKADLDKSKRSVK